MWLGRSAKSSLLLKAALAILLLAAIGLKLLLRGINEAPPTDFQAWMGALLFQHGLRVQYQPAGEMPMVGGSRGNCRLLVAGLSPIGWHRDTLLRMAGPDQQVFFIYKGRRYADLPSRLTLFDHYWGRLARVVGRTPPSNFLLGVIASKGCGEEDTEWLNNASSA